MNLLRRKTKAMSKPSNRVDEFALTFPSFAWLTLFFLVPTVIVFALAFRPYDIYGSILPGWTLSTIKTLFNPNYVAVFWRTFWISILTTILCLSLALPMAYYMARASKRMRKLFLFLVVVPFWSSFLIRIFAWKSLLHPEGFVKKALIAMHVVSPETSLLYNSGAVLLVMVYSYLPFAILPIYAAAEKFNFHLIEAALDLGTTRLQAFIKVFLPGIRTGLITALLMVFIPALGAYVIPDVVGGTESEMIGNKIAQRIFVERNLPLASALSAFLSLIVLFPMIFIAIFSGRSPKYAVPDARSKQ